MITKALPHLQAWTDALVSADIPALPTTVLEIDEFFVIEEVKGTVDPHTLAESIGGDPLMTLKVLAHVSSYCTRLAVEPPETLTGAIVMLSPFGFSHTGEAFNLSMEDVATSAAVALQADKLVFVTEVRGILQSIVQSPERAVELEAAPAAGWLGGPRQAAHASSCSTGGTL